MLRILLMCGLAIGCGGVLEGCGKAEQPVVGYPVHVHVPVAVACVTALPPFPPRYVDMLAPDARPEAQLSAILADQVLLLAQNNELRAILLACQ